MTRDQSFMTFKMTLKVKLGDGIHPHHVILGTLFLLLTRNAEKIF